MGFPRRLLKGVAYQRPLITLAGWLGLRKILRRLYFRLAYPKNGVLSIVLGRLSACFKVHTAEELRVLESLAGGEREVLLRAASQVPAGAVAYDVGANVGLYSVFLAKAVGDEGQVVAFEPENQNHAHLLANVELNGLRNVTCVRVALGEAAGQGRIVPGDIIGNYRVAASSGEEVKGNSVEIVAGDALAERAGLPVPYLVKIDVEGAEHAVVRGLRRTLGNEACRMVCVEVHPYLLPAGTDATVVLDTLRDLGFQREERHRRARDFHAIMWKDGGTDG